MSEFPNDLFYTKSHEWVRRDGDNTYTVGITDHAQCQLGDIVFVELPEIDIEVSASDEVAVVESVKTAADIYTPLTGKIIEVNEKLSSSPETVNADPYTDGWIFRIEASDPAELDDLMNAEDYEAEVSEESEED